MPAQDKSLPSARSADMASAAPGPMDRRLQPAFGKALGAVGPTSSFKALRQARPIAVRKAHDDGSLARKGAPVAVKREIPRSGHR